MDRMHTTGRTELSQFQTLRIILLVFRRGIVAMFANCASQRRNDTVLFTFSGHVLLPSYVGAQFIAPSPSISMSGGRNLLRPYIGTLLA